MTSMTSMSDTESEPGPPPPGALLFLTGATGHTGSRTARRLLDEGYRLRCLVRTVGNRRYPPSDERLEIVEGDLEALESIGESARGVAAVLHLAHVGFAEAVVELCRSAGVGRLICLSSTRRFTRFPEATSRRVVAGEACIEASGLDATILRPSMIYGGSRDNNIEKLVAWLTGHRWMPLVRGGANLVQPIFVDDLVEAIVRALDRPEQTKGKALTLAGPEPLTFREMIETIAAALERPVRLIPVPYWAALAGAAAAELKPGRRWVTRDQVRRLLEDKTFDIAEAREALGDWRPRSFGEGVRLKLAGLD